MIATPLADAKISLASPLVPEPASGFEPEPESTPSPAATQLQWDRILGELDRCRGLQDDWDGQGSRAIDPANIEQAIDWVRDMRRWRRALPPTRVLPGTLGEVILEWRQASFHLAAEIGSAGQVEWLLNLPGQPMRQWETDIRCPWIVRTES